ncbi:MAG TPA: MFS transporter [bacterium]|nr:MFS transporter [bacterium]
MPALSESHESNGSRGFASVLRIRNFALLTTSCSVAQLGDRLTHMLLITVIAASEPGKLMAYSAGSLAFVLPTIIIAPIAGVLVDRWDKRKVLAYVHILQAVLWVAAAFLIIALKSFAPFWVALFVFFGLDVFNNTSVPALIPRLVAPRKLLMANSVNMTLCRIATIIGMVAGGFLIKWAGWKYGLFINASTHLISGLFVLAIAGVYVAQRSAPGASRRGGSGDSPTEREDARYSPHFRSPSGLIAQAFRQLYHDLGEVIRVVGRDKLVAFVMASFVVTMFISSVSYTVLIYIVQQVLKLGTGGVGIFAGVLAVGMVGGGASIGLIRRRINQPMVVVGVVLLFGLLFLASPWLITIWFMVVIALVAGVAFSWLGVVQNTMLQEEVPDSIRGRIFSTREFITNATFLLTTVLVGALGDLTSYRMVLVAFGAVLSVLAVVGWVFVRGMQEQAKAKV